jgi:acylaminoacyl-peptidase
MVLQLLLRLNDIECEMQVPKTLHGSVYNDGWFGSGAAWSPDEDRLAYVAEVRVPDAVNAIHRCCLLILATCTSVTT